MAPEIAAACAAAGMSVRIAGRSAERAEDARRRAEGLGAHVEAAAIDAPAFAGADLVVETVVEDLEVKRALLARIEPWCPPEAVLATNTSSLRIADIAAPLARPERLAGLHFLKPAHLTAVVEVVPGTGDVAGGGGRAPGPGGPDGQDAARGARRRAGLHLEPDPVRRAAGVPPHAGGRDRGRGRHRRRGVGRARPAVDGGGTARHGRPGRPRHLRPGRRPAPAAPLGRPGGLAGAPAARRVRPALRRVDGRRRRRGRRAPGRGPRTRPGDRGAAA